MKPVNESRLLIEIERFVLNVAESQRQPGNFYRSLANLLMDFKTIYNDDFEYIWCIQAFIELMFDMTDYMGNKEATLRMEYADLIERLEDIPFSELQQNFRRYVRKHHRQIRNFRDNEKQNNRQLKQRMQHVSDKYSRILVVRIDLAYLKTKHASINIEDFYLDIQKLRGFIGNRDRVFRGLIESAWALEQGEGKGYHCHLLLVYKGYEHQKGYGIAKRVGELWQRITHDKGCYFNCHDPEYLHSYEDKGTLGIGMIYRKDKQQVKNMLNTVSYLVRPEKEDQHLRVKCSKRMRTFG